MSEGDRQRVIGVESGLGRETEKNMGLGRKCRKERDGGGDEKWFVVCTIAVCTSPGDSLISNRVSVSSDSWSFL